MRRILLLFVAALCAMGIQAADYTTYLTPARGFTEVTSTSQILTGDYYYVIASAENTDLYLAPGAYAAKPGWAHTAVALRYKAATEDLLLDEKSFFTIEKLNSDIGFRNLFYSHSLFQTNEGESYIYVNAFLYEAEISEWDALTPTYQNGYWVFEETKYPGNYLGPWNKVVAADEPIAGNRANTSGDEAGHFRLFRISKSDYNSKLKNARLEIVSEATPANPKDVTWMITNPSFETGDMTGWAEYGYNPEDNKNVTGASGTDNANCWFGSLSNYDGGSFCNYNVWAWSGWGDSQYYITQTVGGSQLPKGIYKLTATLGSYAGRELRLWANDEYTSVTTADSKDANDKFIFESKEASITLNIEGGADINIKAGIFGVPSTWQPFFQADNFQLTCLGQLAETLPLPNNNTTLLEKDQWYYYDAPATARYTLTGNLQGMSYCEGNAYASDYGANPTKKEMGFKAGRVFFKTKRTDATLKVEPVSSATAFTAATLNVDGLPLTLKFPIVGTKDINKGGPGSDGTKLISSYLAEKQIDILAFQEDFNYHSELKSSMSGYTFGTLRNSITTDIIYTRPVDTDGLQFATRNAVASFSGETITKFNSSYSTDVVNISLTKQEVEINDGNSLIKKGFRYYEVTVGGQKIDVYITHADAGSGDQTSSDPYVVSREAQLKQIAQAILSKGNTDRPKIFMGDTNCRWTRENLQKNFVDVLSGTYDVSDAWVELTRGGDYPTSGTSSLSEEVVDKIIYINPKGNNKIKLTPISYTRDSKGYVNSDGTDLGDHAPVIVKFGLGLYEEVDNTVVLGDINYSGKTDVEDIPALVSILLGTDDGKYNNDAADVNQDGEITLADLTRLVDIVLNQQ